MASNDTQNRVIDFLNDEAKRINKINKKIEDLDLKINSTKEQINKLQDEYVTYDLNEDAAGKDKVQKSINSFKDDLSNYEGQRAAYERAKLKDGQSKSEALKIQKEAAKEIKNIWGLLGNKRKEIQDLENEKKAIDKKIEDAQLDLTNTNCQIDNIASHIEKIQDYIYGEGAVEKEYQSGEIPDKHYFILSQLKNMASNL